MRRVAARSAGRGATLLEVVIAVGILGLVMLGVVATISTAQVAQSTSNERLAADSAATSKLDEISSFGADPANFPNLVATYHQTGFDVNHATGEVGYVASGAVSVRVLPPGAPGMFPASRAAAPAAVQLQSGYVEVVDVPTDPPGDMTPRLDLREVRVTVAWRSVSGNQSGAGAQEKIVYAIRIAR